MGISARTLALALRARVALVPRLPTSVVAATLGSAVVLSIALIETSATAKSSYDSRYGFDRTWNAALRYVRVDLGLKVVEKDDTNGYLLFEYRAADSLKTTSGSMEFIRSHDDVKVVVQLPQMPRYHEQVLIDGLVRKMRDDYGDPPPPRKDAPAPPSDAGTDAAPAEGSN